VQMAGKDLIAVSTTTTATPSHVAMEALAW